MNQELYNRIKAAVEGITHQYLFQPADEQTEIAVWSRLNGYLQQLHDGKEIKEYIADAIVYPDRNVLEVNVSYKEPNLANMININLSLGPETTHDDRFDRAMKGI